MGRDELLTVDEMGRADRMAIAAGTSGLALMERAGRGVAECAARIAGRRSIVVLCGPGNNGGDGYVAARYLKNRGHRVRVAALGDPTSLRGDAAVNFKRWQGTVEPLAPMVLEEGCIIVDALFGAGLTRDIDGNAAAVLGAAATLSLPSIAVDLPSGVNGDTGMVHGTALPALETVTFFRRKPAHLLYPGRQLCGTVSVVDIGIPATVLNEISPTTAANSPALWFDTVYGRMQVTDHKFDRGHVVVAGGAEMTGAARLCAYAARRAGAGLVTLAVPAPSWAVYAAGDPGTMVEVRDDFAGNIADARRKTVILGPGLGSGAVTREMVLTALNGGQRRVVLDADALNAFAEDPEILFGAIVGPTVLTPHEGEFKRLFASTGDKLIRARDAARISGAVVVLKGADSVIAAPDGRAAINASAPPWLGTAGAGDVLAGILGGLLAGCADVFEAAAAAVWCHGRTGYHLGPGMIAEDIADALKLVYTDDLKLGERLYASTT